MVSGRDELAARSQWRSGGKLTTCLILLAVSLWPLPLRAADHPLEPLSAAEMRVAFESVLARFKADPELPHEQLLFPFVALAEPDKAFVLAWTRGKPFARRAELHVLHHPSNRSWVAVVDLQARRIVQLEIKASGTQPAIAADEYNAVDELVRAYEPWQQALKARGVDPALAYIDSWAASDVTLPPDVNAKLQFGLATRMIRCLTFQRGAKPNKHPYDRPVEGLVVTLDMNTRSVIHMTDSGARPISSESGAAQSSRALRPLLTQHPSGSEIVRSGRLVRWRDWQFYVALHPREGLVIYDLRFDAGSHWRQVAYRLGLSEIYVPYGLGDANWEWRSAFDVGEYNAGLSAQRLERGRDVPSNAQLMDATFFSSVGPTPKNPNGTLPAPGSLALYERDAGVLWTRTDPSTRERDTRPARELVATWSCWIGNYVYVFDWIFKLDGSIEVRVQLTGTTLNRGTDGEPEAGAPKVGKDAQGVFVAAPNHQHFLSFRLDLDVDGPDNRVMEMQVGRAAAASFKNAFDVSSEYIDAEGHRDLDPLSARHWHVESASKTNLFGKPTSYALEPETFAVPLSAPDFPALQRATFAQHALWLTRYRDSEQYASGQFPNQAKRADGVGVYVEPSEPLIGQDVVLWYTIGFTHVSRPEDYPVMPSESIGFKLQPRGFFDHNPSLAVGAPR